VLFFECPEPKCSRQYEHPWTLLDGHHRYAICQAHTLDFTVVETPPWVKTREDAKIWIIENQFARRNLAPYQRAELALVLEPMIAARAKRQQGMRTDLAQNSAKGFEPIKTREEVAKRAAVSHDTIRKAKVIMREADEATKNALRRGERTIHRAFTELREPKAGPKRQEATDASSGLTASGPYGGPQRLPGAIWDDLIAEMRPYNHGVEELARTGSLDLAKSFLSGLQQLIAELEAMAQRMETDIRSRIDA
jgi:ParB-like chromosome segregation protein Spo0J